MHKLKINIPKEFRKEFTDGGVVVRGPHDSLCFYTKENWKKQLEKFDSQFDDKNIQLNTIIKLVKASAHKIIMDNTGNIFIPKYFEKDLEGELTFGRFENRLEISKK